MLSMRVAAVIIILVVFLVGFFLGIFLTLLIFSVLNIQEQVCYAWHLMSMKTYTCTAHVSWATTQCCKNCWFESFHAQMMSNWSSGMVCNFETCIYIISATSKYVYACTFRRVRIIVKCSTMRKTTTTSKTHEMRQRHKHMQYFV